MKQETSNKSFLLYFSRSVKLCWVSSPLMFVLRLILEVVIIVMPIVLSYQLKRIVNLFVEDKPNVFYLFVMMLLSVVAIRIASVLFKNINTILSDNHNEIINHNIDKQILVKINELDISYFDSPDYLNEINNTYTDARALQELAFMVIKVIRSTIQILSCFAILLQISVWVPMLSLFLMIPAVFVDNYIVKKRYEWERASVLSRRKINYIKTLLNGPSYAKDIRIFHTSKYLFDKYESLWKAWFKEKRSVYRRGTMLSSISQILPHIGVYTILFIVGREIINRVLTVGDFTLYNGISIQFIDGVVILFSSLNKAYESNRKLSNFYNFMSLRPINTLQGTIKIKKIDSIEFQNVSFAYPNTNKYILKNVSFTLNHGKMTALVGENGAGKTTIAKLILNLYHPTEGTVLINHINIKEIEPASLHNALGVVFQDFNTYELVLREAVAITNVPQMNDDESVRSACTKADFDIDAQRFTYGLDTYIGKSFDANGVILSGGQKQKLAIAQAYFKTCSYYIMDEPNSALDPIAENDLIRKLEQLSGESGAFIISHKMSVMHMADEIIVLDNGEIVETGTHHELMRNDGVYKKMYSAQADKYKD